MTTALYPGSFDPVTNGHLDIARRAASLFDHLVVGVAGANDGPTARRYSTLFSTDERVALFQEAVSDHPNITVLPYTGLTVDFARKQGAKVLIRSMRGSTDFEDEFNMALMNQRMAPEIESLYLIAHLQYLFISGTLIREVASLGYDVSELVPPHVAVAIKQKIAGV